MDGHDPGRAPGQGKRTLGQLPTIVVDATQGSMEVGHYPWVHGYVILDTPPGQA
jgi:hypothetical protein